MRYTNISNRLNDDSCSIKNRSLVDESIVNRDLFNYYFNKDCSCPVLDDIAFDNNFVVREGYGYASGCTVDNDSSLRLNSKITHDRARMQLCARTFTGVPNLSKGGLVPNIESRLLNADDTSDIRNIDKLSEKSFIPLTFTPMIGCLVQNVQNPVHIIPTWTLGGQTTRQDMADNSYMSKCGFQNNGNQWVKK